MKLLVSSLILSSDNDSGQVYLTCKEFMPELQGLCVQCSVPLEKNCFILNFRINFPVVGIQIVVHFLESRKSHLPSYQTGQADRDAPSCVALVSAWLPM